jgi:hypothetical protein
MANAPVLKTGAAKAAYRFESCALRWTYAILPTLRIRVWEGSGKVCSALRSGLWTGCLRAGPAR